MGESRNVFVKWVVDTANAVLNTDKYKKSVQGAGQAQKEAGKSAEQFRGELGSQIKTMFGLGAVVQTVGNAFNSYNAQMQESAKVTFENAVATEALTGRISQLGNAQRLANQAQRNALVSGEAAQRQLRIQQAQTELSRTGGGRTIQAIQEGAGTLPGIGPLLRFIANEVLAESNLGGGGQEESTAATRRAEFIRRGEEIVSEAESPRAQARALNALLEEAQKSNTFNLSTVRKAAETQ